MISWTCGPAGIGHGRLRAAGTAGRGVGSLGPLAEALSAAGGSGTAVARLLVQDSWRWLTEEVDLHRGNGPPSRPDQGLVELGRPVLAVIKSTAVIAATDLRDEALGFLCQEGDDLLPCLMAVLRAARPLPPPQREDAGLDALARHCAERIQARLALPPRRDDDWSIDPAGRCSCEVCNVLCGFLLDPARRTFEWPLAKEGRRHVHSRLDLAELPVSHQTRRTGRPYTLVLTKTGAIFERDRQARRCDEVDLAWLSGWDSTTDRTSPRR